MKKALCFLLLALFCCPMAAHAWDYDYDLIDPTHDYNVNLRGANSGGLAIGFSGPRGDVFIMAGGNYMEYSYTGYPTYGTDINESNWGTGFFLDGSSGMEKGIFNQEGSGGVQEIVYNDGTGDLPTIVNGLSEPVDDGQGGQTALLAGIYLRGGVGLVGEDLYAISGYMPYTPPNIDAHGFWRNANGDLFPVDYPNSRQTYAWDINSQGLLVGYYKDIDESWHGFTYDTNTGNYAPVDFQQNGRPYPTFLTGVNNQGEMAGYFSILDSTGPAHLMGYVSGNLSMDRAAPAVYLAGFAYRQGEFIRIEIYEDTRVYRVMENGTLVGDVPYAQANGQACGDCEYKECRSGFLLTLQESQLPAPPTPPVDSPALTGPWQASEIPIQDPGAGMSVFAPMAIGNNGWVVGMAPDPAQGGAGMARPFIWKGSGAPVFLGSQDQMGWVTDINDSGEVAGIIGPAEISDALGYTPFTYTEQGGLVQESYLGSRTLGYFIFFNRAFLDNDGNMAITILNFDLGNMPGMYFKKGLFDQTARGILPSTFNGIYDMNNYGRVVGYTESDYTVPQFNGTGFVWKADEPQAEIVPDGDSELIGLFAIADNGISVGARCPAIINSFVYEPTSAVAREPDGSITILESLPEFTNCAALDVNESGEIVGMAWADGNFLTETHMVLWTRSGNGYGPPVDLNQTMTSLGYDPEAFIVFNHESEAEDIPESAVWTLLINAIGIKINDNHQIVTCAYKSDGTPVGVVLTPSVSQGCVEDDLGQLDVAGTALCSGDGATMDVPIRIQSSPGMTDAFGFEVTFDPAKLQFEEFVPGDLLAGFWTAQANLVADGVIRVGAYTIDNKIAAGTTGVLGYVRFRPSPEAESVVDLQNLDDDMEGWTSSHGCVKRSDGDLNLDGEVSPDDALCALEKAMVACPTTCGPCESTLCDVDQNCACTADDSLCMLYWYLELESCLDDLLPR